MLESAETDESDTTSYIQLTKASSLLCIFCRGPFGEAPPEHFIASGVGGNDTINCVCQDCNHGVLAKIDARIRENLQLSMAIDGSALGRPCEIQHSGGTITRKVRIVDGRTNKLRYDARTADGAVQPTNIKITLKPEEDAKLYKVFAKIFFETLAFEFGGEELLKPKYDCLRDFILSASEQVPKGVDIRMTSVSILNGNTISELISFDQARMLVNSREYTVLSSFDLRRSSIVLGHNEAQSCSALVILLGGKKSGRITCALTIPDNFTYFVKARI